MFNLGNALSNVKAAISPVISKAKSAVASILPKTPQQITNDIINPVPNVVAPIISGAFKTIRTGIENAQPKIDEVVSKIPSGTPVLGIGPFGIGPSMPNINAQKFAADTVTGLAHDFAYTGEKLTSPEGLKEVATSAVNLPKTISEKGFFGSLNEPAMIVGMTGLNFLTGGGEEVVGKQAAEMVAKGAVNEADRVAAEQVLKDAATSSGLWKSLVTKAGDFLEPYLNSPLATKLKDFVTPGADWIKKVPGGEEMVNLVMKTTKEADIMMGKYARQLAPIMKDLSDEEFAQALDVQRGLLEAPNEKIANAAKTLNAIFQEYGQMASDLGLKVKTLTGETKDFVPLKNYVPQRLNLDLIKQNPDLQAALANYLAETKQITDAVVNGETIPGTALERAQKFVTQLTQDVPVRTAFAELFPNNTLPKRMGNLEMERIFDLPSELNGYKILDSSKKLITDYIKNASNRIAQVANFGLNNEVLNKFQKDTAGLAYSKEAVDIIKRTFGLEPKSVLEIMNERSASKFKTFESLTKLGTAAISNATQSVNTATSYGIGPTMRAIFQDFLHRPESANFAEDAGIAVESSLRDMASEEMGNAKGFLSKLMAPGFKEVEAFNRRVAANAGKLFAIDEFNKLINNPADKDALSALEKFGVDARDALQVGKLSEDDLINAARKAVDTTQFQVTPMDLPPAFTSTWGRVLTQFKSFGYKQAQFFLQEVLKPALTEGNFAPVTRYLTSAIAAGEVAADLKFAIRGKKRATDPMARAWENIQQVGGLGIMSDALNAAAQYQGLPAWIMGPTVGDAVDLTYEMINAAKGKPVPLLRDLTRKIPVVGPYISTAVFPSTNVSKTKVLNGGGAASYGPSKLGY